MKLDLTKILLVLAVFYIGWVNFFKSEIIEDPEPVTITISEFEGTSGKINIEPYVIRDTIRVKGDVIEIDKGYKELYEKAKNSLTKRDLFLEAIKIKNYEGVLVDNNDITIKGTATTRGTLLDYSVDYTIKERSLTYTPKVVTRLPKLSAGLGLEVGVPTAPETSFVLKANLTLMNIKGNAVDISYDTDKRVWVGFSKSFKIIK